MIPTTPDVIIIGSGFAGLTAAIECTSLGLSVIVLEKMKAIGGNSILSDGGLAAAGTDLQHRHGIPDSAEIMFEDMMISAAGLNDPAICAMVCSKSNEAFMWAREVLQVPFMDRIDIFGGHRVKRCYSPDPLSGTTILLKMKAACDLRRIPIHMGMNVTSLLKDKQNRICGVTVDPDYHFQHPQHSPSLTLTAKKAILVASGGYAADITYLRSLLPDLPENTQSTNKRSATADLLNHCKSIGAATRLLDTIQWLPWTSPDEPGYGRGGLFGDYIVSSSGILINPSTGLRFVNERSDRRMITQQIHATAPWVIGLLDHRAVMESGWDLTLAIKKGIIKTHDNLLDVAKTYHISGEALKSTLQRTNDAILGKIEDDFGKAIESWMHPLVKPPFYTMRIQPKTHYCPGGLVTDTSLRVLDEQNQPIIGLYAVGEVTGMTHGANRLGSCSITECLVLGREVAHSIIADAS
jgi:flavocytochrome c